MKVGPRPHLYVFAHRALPALGQGHPKQMLGALCGPQCSDFLTMVWQDIGRDLSPAEVMEFPEVACTIKRHDQYLMAMFHFPQPMEITEPFFSALVFGPIEEGGALDGLGVRYFILESGITQTGAARTVLCEWAKGSHVNFGDGPDSVMENFEKAVWKAVHES